MDFLQLKLLLLDFGLNLITLRLEIRFSLLLSLLQLLPHGLLFYGVFLGLQRIFQLLCELLFDLPFSHLLLPLFFLHLYFLFMLLFLGLQFGNLCLELLLLEFDFLLPLALPLLFLLLDGRLLRLVAGHVARRQVLSLLASPRLQFSVPGLQISLVFLLGLGKMLAAGSSLFHLLVGRGSHVVRADSLVLDDPLEFLNLSRFDADGPITIGLDTA